MLQSEPTTQIVFTEQNIIGVRNQDKNKAREIIHFAMK